MDIASIFAGRSPAFQALSTGVRDLKRALGYEPDASFTDVLVGLHNRAGQLGDVVVVDEAAAERAAAALGDTIEDVTLRRRFVDAFRRRDLDTMAGTYRDAAAQAQPISRRSVMQLVAMVLSAVAKEAKRGATR